MGATLSAPCRPEVLRRAGGLRWVEMSLPGAAPRRAKGRPAGLARMGATLSVPTCLAAQGAIKVLGPVGMPLPVPYPGKGPAPCKQGLGQRAA